MFVLSGGDPVRIGVAARISACTFRRGRRFAPLRDIAMNWLQYGVYALPTPARWCPRFLAFRDILLLAALFAIFGWSNFRAVLLIQVLFDLTHVY